MANLLQGTGPMTLCRPPSDFSQRKLKLIRAPRTLFRLSDRRHSSPLFWGNQGRYRFDSPSAPFGVLYTASSLKGAILETFGDRWYENRYLARATAKSYNVYRLTVRPAIEVADATGQQLSRLGTDSSLFASTDYSDSQAWGVAFMQHPMAPEGILYHSRKNPDLKNFALFSRKKTKEKVSADHGMNLLQHPDFFLIIDQLDVDLV
jgi:hypothetical protein